MRLGPEQRIRRSADYRQMARTARRLRSPLFTAWIQRDPGTSSRLGMAVSAKMGKAVRRNKLRRRLREIFRHRLQGDEGLSLVIVARPGAAELSFPELHDQVIDLIDRALAAPRGDRRPRADRTPKTPIGDGGAPR